MGVSTETHCEPVNGTRRNAESQPSWLWDSRAERLELLGQRGVRRKAITGSFRQTPHDNGSQRRRNAASELGERLRRLMGNHGGKLKEVGLLERRTPVRT